MPLFEKMLNRGTARRWAKAARNAAVTDLTELRQMRSSARLLRSHLDRLIHTADERLALPAIGSTAFPRPHDSDWHWRPELWRGALPVKGMSTVETKSMLGNEVTLFHDCSFSELTLRQIRNIREEDLAPYGLRLDVFRFEGSFLSLVVDLPGESIHGLRRTHLIRLDCIIELEKPIEIFARLNVRHGPNTEQIVRELPLHEDEVMVEFDLAYADLNEKRLGDVWMDLICENPKMNQIVVRDITFCRYPRAEL